MRTLLAVLVATLALGLSVPADAARQFDGTDDCLSSASAIDLSGGAQLSIAIWSYQNAYANDDRLLVEHGTSISDTPMWHLNPNDSGVSQFSVAISGGSPAARHFPRSSASAGAWHPILIVIDGTLMNQEITAAYVDGSAVSLTDILNPDSVTAFGNKTLYVMSRACASLFNAGRIAEIAVWKRLLSAADASELYNSGNGLAATSLSSGGPDFYWKVCGDASPEPAVAGGVDLTVTGATQVAHPFSNGCVAAAPPRRRAIQW